MEGLALSIDPVLYDQSIGRLPGRGPVLPECGDLAFVVKPKATENGKACVAITFTVRLPDGTFARAQAVTTAALIESAGLAVRGWREGGHI